jgi:hypothetical protein
VKRSDKPARSWMFWRRAFWTRPAVWAIASVALVVGAPFVGMDGYHSIRNRHVVDSGAWCGDHDRPCYTRLEGELHGPFWTRRDPGHGWRLWVAGTNYDEFDADESWDAALAGVRTNATAFVVSGDVVAIDTPDGYIRVWGLGWPGAFKDGLLVLACLGAAIGALDYGRRKARAHGSWWSLEGPAVDPASRWGASLLVPASFGYLAMLFTPWWQFWGAVLAAGFVFSLWKLVPWSGRPSLDRHKAAEPDQDAT